VVKDDFDTVTPKLTTNVVGDNIQPKEIQSDIYINSPKLKIDKTFESNYKGEEERLKYTIDVTNERKDSIAKKVTLVEKTTNGRLDKDSIRVKDDVKKNAELVCAEIGMSVSTAINIFLKRLGNEGRIPFEIGINDPFYKKDNIEYLEQKMAKFKTGKLNFNSHELIGE